MEQQKLQSELIALSRAMIQKMAADLTGDLTGSLVRGFSLSAEDTRILEDATNLLGADENEKYLDMSMNEVIREIEAKKEIDRLIRSGKATPSELMRLFRPDIRPLRRGRPKETKYDTAFERVYILKSHTTKQAFEAMLQEAGITIMDASDYDSQWEAFRAAIGERRRKYVR